MKVQTGLIRIKIGTSVLAVVKLVMNYGGTLKSGNGLNNDYYVLKF